MRTTIGYGSTVPGATLWQPYKGSTKAMFVDIDTSEAGFSATPLYFTSIGGKSRHWEAQGVESVYDATAKGFRIYIQASHPGQSTLFTPEEANKRRWHINWFGVVGS
ncbi:MAG: hypothetical protein ACRBK7_23095 [Acidimicrobiales bacterium]